MAPRRRPEAAGLAHQVWRQLCALAEQHPDDFPAETRDENAGWLWEGPVAALMRRAAPGTPDSDRRRAKEYLQAAGMLANVRGYQSGGVLPMWFIRRDWHEGAGGHPPATARQRRVPQPEAPQAAVRPDAARETHYPDVTEAVRNLVDRAGGLEADNGRLRADNDRLRADNERLRADNEQLAAENARLRGAAQKAAELLAEAGKLGRRRPAGRRRQFRLVRPDGPGE